MSWPSASSPCAICGESTPLPCGSPTFPAACVTLAGGRLLCAGLSSRAGVNLPEHRSSRGSLIMKTHLQTVLWGLMICLVVFSFQWATAPRAVAQDGDDTEDTTADDEAPAKKKAAKAGNAAEATEGEG